MKRASLAMAVVCGVTFSSIAQANAASTDGLSYREDTVFTVLDDSVRVDTVAVMTNTTTERRSGNTIYYSYFDEFLLVVPTDATELWVSSRGQSLTTTKDALDDDFDLVTAYLPSQLRSGESRTVDVSFVLPRGEIRGDGVFFSNPAFQAFPIWSFSDAGSGSLRIRVPTSALFSHFGQPLEKTATDGGYDVWEPTDFSHPDQVFTYATVTNDGALFDTPFTASSQNIVLRSWPGDEVWVTFAKDTIETGLPTLEALIGLPVPDQDSLEITESVTPYYYGYGGWYDPEETSIEVGNELDDTVMLHELSHAWFNNALFRERWIAEGLAEEFTWRTQHTLNWPTETLPRKPQSWDPGAAPLLDWGNGSTARLGDDAFRSSEEYGYNASWYTVHDLVGIVGLEGIQQVIAAADGDIVSYVGDDVTEKTNKSDDWKRLLDLLSEAGDVEDEQAIEQVFVDYVVRPDSTDELEARRAARAAYANLLAQDLDWRVPRGIRQSLTNWNFDDATNGIDDALAVQARHLELINSSKDAGLELSDAARIAYESDAAEEPDFIEAASVLDAQFAAIPDIEEIRTTYLGEPSLNQRWGLGDIDLEPLVRIAESAYAQDDYDGITKAQHDLDEMLASAESVGAERIRWMAIGAASIGLTLAVALWIRFRRNDFETVELSQEDVVLLA